MSPIYFISAGAAGPIKIGFVEVDFPLRLRGLQVASFEELIVLKLTAGTYQDEQAIHQRFASARIRGEWFKPTPALLAYIEGCSTADPPSKPPRHHDSQRRLTNGVFTCRKNEEKATKKAVTCNVPSLPKHERRAMNQTEWRQLLAAAWAAGTRETALLTLLYDACLRAGEVAKVTLAHCRHIDRGKFYAPRSKGGRSGWLNLGTATANALAAWIDILYPVRSNRQPELPLFTTRRYRGGEKSHPMSRYSVYRIVERLGEAAQIPKNIAHPHAIRHGFIMHYLEKARAAGLTFEQMLPDLAARIGHQSAWTTIMNYLSETAGAKRVIQELVAEMLGKDDLEIDGVE